VLRLNQLVRIIMMLEIMIHKIREKYKMHFHVNQTDILYANYKVQMQCINLDILHQSKLTLNNNYAYIL